MDSIPLSLIPISALVLVPATIFWYLFIYDDSVKQAARRNVKSVRFENMFWAMLCGRRFERMTMAMIEKEGKVFGCNWLNSFTIFVAEPELIGQIFAKEFTSFPNRRDFLIPDPVFTENLAFAPVDKWKRLRSIITPTFSAGKLRQMKPNIDQTAQKLVKNLDLVSGQVIDAKHYMESYTMDTITRIALGVKLDSLLDTTNPILLNARKLLTFDLTLGNLIGMVLVFYAPIMMKLMNLRFQPEATAFFMKFAQKIINEKRATFEKHRGGGASKAKDFIELMLETEMENKADDGLNDEKPSKYMTTEEIISSCVLFFLAGTETTATTLTMFLYNMALHPEIQDRLHDEIESTLAALQDECGEEADVDASGNPDPCKLVTFDNLSRFEYLSACLNESLRLYPPGTFNERAAIRDSHLETADGKYKINIKKGDILHIPTYSVHHLADHFPDPERFNPDRFMGPANSHLHHKYAHIPFGAGPRICVAKSLAEMEAKMALIQVLRRYRFSVCDGTKIPMNFWHHGQLLLPKEVLLKIEKW